MKELIFNENEFDYKDALDTFIESQVVIEDRKVAQTKMNLDYIFLTLQKDGDYFVQYEFWIVVENFTKKQYTIIFMMKIQKSY